MKSEHLDKWISDCSIVGAKIKIAKDNNEGLTLTAEELQTLIKMINLLRP